MTQTGDRPGSLSALRATNRERVLVALRAGGLTQARLARETGLSAASVSGIVRELADEGAVRTRPGELDGRRGRLVELADDTRAVAAGVDLGRSHVRVVLGPAVDDLGAERAVELDPGAPPDEVLAVVSDLVRACCAEAALTLDDLVGVGVAVAWPVDPTGALPGTPAPGSWGGLHLGDLLGERLGCEVVVGNDANLGATALAHLERLDQPVVYVKVGTGIGAGIAYRGEVLRGRSGFAGDLGHLTVDPTLATVCQCGRRGCLETVASLEAVRRTLATATGTTPTARRALELVAQGDPVAVRVLDEAGDQLGRALGWLATILDPALVVLGGPAASAGEALLRPVTGGFRRAVTTAIADTPVRLSPLGERTEAVGALLHALEQHVPRP